MGVPGYRARRPPEAHKNKILSGLIIAERKKERDKNWAESCEKKQRESEVPSRICWVVLCVGWIMRRRRKTFHFQL